MSRIRSKNTTPELTVRRFLTNKGFKYRLHVRNMPGNPDIVMKKTKTAIFVNGCFWHQHGGCKRNTSPQTNSSYWRSKLEGNVDRQRNAIAELKKERWNVVTVWECEAKEESKLINKLDSVLVK